jgi:hypothetical protein
MKKLKKEKEPEIFFKSVKDNLNNILIEGVDILDIIQHNVKTTNKIVVHTYQFLKLYLIYLFDNNLLFPDINTQFFRDVFYVLTSTKSKCGKKKDTEQLTNIQLFYNNYYNQTVTDNEIIYKDSINDILDYEITDIVTNVSNNITEHFIGHLNKYINITFDLKGKLNNITNQNKDIVKRKLLHKELRNEFKQIKNDLIYSDKQESKEEYHIWIQEQKLKLFQNKQKTFMKNSIHYDVKSNTMDYLYPMIYINKELEKLNHTKLFNVVPLRTNIVPKHITYDTNAIIKNLLPPKSSHYKITFKKKNQYNEIWSKVFNLDAKSFKKSKKHNFNYMIKTDGYSVSILFNYKSFVNTENESMKYIEDCINEIGDKRIVVADPNKSDLIYCGSKNDEGELETFRYTQKQRMFETKQIYYKTVTKELSKTIIEDEKNVKQLETELSFYNSKTCVFDKFMEYCKVKNNLNSKLFEHYSNQMYRKIKMNIYTNTQKSESKMLKNFKKKYGNHKKTVFVIGDYDSGSYNMKGCEPSVCKKFRKIFKKARYQTFLINEFRTSMICNECNGKLEKFIKLENRKNMVHGLLRCQSVKHKCERYLNRDKNAVLNMLRIVESVKESGVKPDIFCRECNA